ncbi:MAG: pantoate--beta-alanine ligase [Phycisphaerales bacterium]|nr:MAG: pantoate--beta-alanine ligase [Phycisphaerales bacterium]
MQVAETISSVRKAVKAAHRRSKTIGFVPTMGALHVGHLSLIEAAKKDCDYVIVSIFVNPTQFGPGEDFQKYPRPLEKDLDMCRKAGVDLVFAPAPAEMYKSGNITWVTVEKLTDPLCGRSRPGHFRGVTTVCAKLFNIVGPDLAYFGQKDAQQAIVIRRMVEDLNMPLQIVICPTAREPDGLAVSSRNKYLNADQRKDAAALYRSLEKCRRMVEAGTTDTAALAAEMRKTLGEFPAIEIEYLSIVDAETLEDTDRIAGRALVALAARLGPARLIDNIIVEA